MKGHIVHKPLLPEYEAPAPFQRCAKLLMDPDLIEGAALSIGVFRYAPGQVGPPHKHQKEAEVYYILHGTGSLRLGEEWIELREGMAVYIPPGLEHETRNTGPAELEFLGIFAPASGFDTIKATWPRLPQNPQ
jgi:mannose-6-phosphate isomerase-like protein (cupin superfamily)